MVKSDDEKVDEAVAELERAVADDPKNAAAQAKLADALALRGDVGGALDHYNQALKIDPKFAAAKQGLARLLNP